MFDVTVTDKTTLETISLGGILNYSGLDAPEYEIYTEKKARGAGSVITGSRVAERTITFTCVPRAEARIYSFLKPDREYTISLNGIHRIGDPDIFSIDGYVDSLKCGTTNFYAPAEYTVTFLCPDPFFYGPATARSIPANSETNFFIEGDFTVLPTITLTVPGAVATLAYNGLAINLPYSLAAGEAVVINVARGTVIRSSTGKSILTYASLTPSGSWDSTKLQPGNNTIKTVNASAKVSYSLRYQGV